MSNLNLRSRIEIFSQTARSQLPQLAEVDCTKDHLNAAIDWIFLSQDVNDSAGSSAGYNLVFGWQEDYPETTGYIIPTLYRFASETGSEEAKNRATRMAEWLISVQLSNGGFPGKLGTTGDPRIFNTGQILLGLVAAFHHTEREEFRGACIDAADWLVEVQSEEGSWPDFTYNEKAHIYHTRVAWSLLEVDSIKPNTEYIEAALANYQWALEHQHPNGWFENTSFSQSENPYLHTIAYSVRGLIEGGIILDDTEIFEAGKKSADVLLTMQENQGILKGRFDQDWNGTWYYCLPGNAQMANIWLRLYDHTGDRRYLMAASHTIQFLKRHQIMDSPSSIFGSLAGSYPVFGRYMFFRYPNWGVKFLADALLTFEQLSPIEVEKPDKDETDVCRVCILFEGEYTMRWVAQSIEKMLERTNTEISLVVINDDSGLFSRGNLIRAKKYPSYYTFQLLLLLTNKLSTSNNYEEMVHISDISGINENKFIRTYSSKTDGLWNELPRDVIEEITDSSDVIFRRGFGLIQGDILQATPLGVLSYHHGDPRAYRGGPAGFWEYMNDENSAGSMVQLLTDELDAGGVLAYHDMDINSSESWGDVRRELYTNSTHLLAEAIENVRNEEFDMVGRNELGPINHPPSMIDLGRYFKTRLKNKFI